MLPTVSAVFNDSAILEMVYEPTEKRSAFVLWRDGEWKIETGLNVSPLQRWVPYSANNNLNKLVNGDCVHFSLLVVIETRAQMIFLWWTLSQL
jgi:hypothetical protein